jgi:hypothetical protein
MTFGKPKIKVRMRRKAWRPLTIAVCSFMLYEKTWKGKHGIQYES